MPRNVSIFVLGYGKVGKAFLRMLPGVLPAATEVGINLKLIGAANSSSLIFDPKGIEVSDNLSSHDKCEKNPGLEEILRRLRAMAPENLIVIDLTAADTTNFLKEILKAGSGVVTANKRPLAGALEEFKKIRPYCNLSPGIRYECTAGGGLPIISTLARLSRSGDEIVDIRGLLSGTLGYIMSEVSRGKPFSECVREAYLLGYTEPDPRDDLSGADVKRKALILSRTLGAELDEEAVLVESLVPEELQDMEVKDFLDGLRMADHKYRRSEPQGYVVTVTPEMAKVGIEQLSSGDPLSSLSGPENMVVIRTKKYFSHPLVIRGPGAGAEVTAQGIIGDLLRISGAL